MHSEYPGYVSCGRSNGSTYRTTANGMKEKKRSIDRERERDTSDIYLVSGIVSHDRGVETRGKEFPWDYAALVSPAFYLRIDRVPALAYQCPTESNPAISWRHGLIGLPQRRRVEMCLFLSKKCPRKYEERILISIYRYVCYRLLSPLE